MDGIDAALLETDGHKIINPRGFFFRPYDEAFKKQLRGILGTKTNSDGQVAEVERCLTTYHFEAVQALLTQENKTPSEIDLIGFHGHTITHDPDQRFTWQIGDGETLAKATGINTVYDLRQKDVQYGGQGAPLAPIYHWAIAQKQKLALPTVFLNIGGVANVTFITDNPAEMIAFDTGPGNALIDDLMQKHFDRPFDENGAVAAQGCISQHHLEHFLAHDYFNMAPPKSLDRESFATMCQAISDLSPEDQVATVTALTAHSIAKALEHLPQKPARWLIAGGGRKNATLIQWLHDISGIEPCSIDTLAMNGDAIEAQLFGYLAVRSVLKEPFSFAKTTGAQKPLSGGQHAIIRSD